ncbi:hypothetical protein CBL_05676 [Carabus blaptoides fortunei]
MNIKRRRRRKRNIRSVGVQRTSYEHPFWISPRKYPRHRWRNTNPYGLASVQEAFFVQEEADRKYSGGLINPIYRNNLTRIDRTLQNQRTSCFVSVHSIQHTLKLKLIALLFISFRLPLLVRGCGDVAVT